MGELIEFPGQKLPENLLVQWGPDFHCPSFIEFDLEGEDKMYSVSTSEGEFLFNILIANGALFVHNPDVSYFEDFLKDEMTVYCDSYPFEMPFLAGDRLILDWTTDRPFLEYSGSETRIRIISEPLPKGWTQFVEDVENLAIGTYREKLNAFAETVLEEDEFDTAKRFGSIGDAPFSVSKTDRFAIDEEWSIKLIATGLLVHPMYWTSHYIPGPESAIRMEIVTGGYLTLISKIDDPMITAQIQDGPEEEIHKDMLLEYLTRNV